MMQEETTIRTRQLSKIYRIYPGPRALLRELLSGKTTHEPVQALDDVSFSIPRGEAFGLVGDNGSGKSTLLKILAGTCSPSGGKVEVRGNVSALLELGAGFHPEFTGLENIYFTGALMGLDKEEVRRREAEIIAFSELGSFIRQPVRTYSSGMHLRLGFSVATGFESDILIIDEALAVGDQSFQKKCIDRIHEFREAGRTILFCSHNLHQVKTFCSRTLWLDKGRVKGLGPSSEVVGRYHDFSRRQAAGSRPAPVVPDAVRRTCWIESVRLKGQPANGGVLQVRTGETLELDVVAYFDRDFSGEPAIGLGLVRNDGVMILTTASCIDHFKLHPLGSGRYACRIRFPRLQLLTGLFSFSVFTTDQHRIHVYDAQEGVAPFEVTHSENDHGLTRLEHEWTIPDEYHA